MKRRTFIGKTAAGAAALSAGTSILSSCMKNRANGKVVLALIGAGNRGRKTVINACRVNEDVEIKYVCDVNSVKLDLTLKEIEMELGYRPLSISQMDEAFHDKDVDAVWVATPEHWHALAAIRALQAGKHVYVEKNPSLTIWEGRKMVEAASRYRRIVQTGFQNRSAAYCFSARKFIESGRLGRVVHVKCYNMLRGARWVPMEDEPVPDGLDWNGWLGPAPYRPYNPGIHQMERRGGWGNFWDFGGGSLSDDASHVLDLARLVLGDPGHPGAVYCCGGNWAWNSVGKETPEYMSITYDFDDFTMTCESGKVTHYMSKTPWDIRSSDTRFPAWNLNSTRIEIYGTEGLMLLGRHGGGWQVFGKEGKLVEQEYGIFPDDAHQQNFIASIRGEEKPNGNAVQGHLSASLVHLGNIAYRSGNRHLVFDPEKEIFVNDEQANSYLTSTYRDPYAMPERI